jgi:hypothetical protein
MFPLSLAFAGLPPRIREGRRGHDIMALSK